MGGRGAAARAVWPGCPVQGRVLRVKIAHDVRTHHDEWIKDALALWLRGLGDVVAEARIVGRSRRGDVLYKQRGDDPALRGRLGELGEIAKGIVLFEVFRNAPNPLDVKKCVVKVVELEAAEERVARREKRATSTIETPSLCVVVPSMSREFAVEMGIKAMRGKKRGLYTLLGMRWRTRVVVANELPDDVSTMWLRLLSRGKVRVKAMEQLRETGEQEPLYDATLGLIEEWSQTLPKNKELSEDDREVLMFLEQTFREREAAARVAAKAEGKAEGEVKGMAKAVLSVLDSRGLTVTAAQRRQIVACTNLAQLDAWVRAAGTTPSAGALFAGGAPHSRRKRSSSIAKPPPRRSTPAR